jgi:uncharacterized protein YcbK (DUF882 family)
MDLSANFSLKEFSVSSQRPDLTEPVPASLLPNLRRLVTFGLQPVRSHTGRPMRILSGYRPSKLNFAVGGSSTSQHLQAAAADFVFSDGNNSRLQSVMRGLMEGTVPEVGSLGQVIYYPHRQFVHMAIPSTRYKSLTLCVHHPAKGLHYTIARDLSHLDRMMMA